VFGLCEHFNENSVSINDGEFLIEYYLLKNDPDPGKCRFTLIIVTIFFLKDPIYLNTGKVFTAWYLFMPTGNFKLTFLHFQEGTECTDFSLEADGLETVTLIFYWIKLICGN
jgi:hypothetical protein